MSVRLKMKKIRPKSELEMGFGLKQLGLENLGPKTKFKIKIFKK